MEQILYILPRGILIGLLISAPMGPIGMLVIQRTLSKGRWPGFFTGVGASASDLVYCLLTGFGMSFIGDMLETHQLAIKLLGSVVLAAFGFFLFRKNPTRALKTRDVNASDYWSDLITGFLLTFSNPLILFFIIGLFARFNFLLPEMTMGHHVFAYVTILIGAFVWWFGVTYLVHRLGKRINVRSLRFINRTIACILMVMALVGAGMGLYDVFNA